MLIPVLCMHADWTSITRACGNIRWRKMLNVHGLRIPCAHGLLPGKTNLPTSRRSWTGSPLKPRNTRWGSATAGRNAVLNVWPGTTLRGYYFHFNQALWRRFTRPGPGVSNPWLGGPQLLHSPGFKMVGALPFVPLGDRDRAWRYLKPTLTPDMEPYAAYVYSAGALFDAWSWNQHDVVLGPGGPPSLLQPRWRVAQRLQESSPWSPAPSSWSALISSSRWSPAAISVSTSTGRTLHAASECGSTTTTALIGWLTATATSSSTWKWLLPWHELWIFEIWRNFVLYPHLMFYIWGWVQYNRHFNI